MNTASDCNRQIKKAKNIAIITHTRPDTDAIASSLTLKEIILNNYFGKSVHVFIDENEIGEINKALISDNDFLNSKSNINYDLAIAVDCANIDLLGKFVDVFNNAQNTINIDHHATNTDFAEYNYVYNFASATEVVFNLFENELNCNLTKRIYKLIYAGIVTDTNNEKQNMYSSTYELIAKLKDKIEVEKIKEFYFNNDSMAKKKLLSNCIENIKFDDYGRLALMRISRYDMMLTGATDDDTLGLVDEALTLQGVQIGIMLISIGEKSYKISLRSRANSSIDVAKIAQKFGGGGHQKMAAFIFEGNLSDVLSNLFDECRNEISLYENEPQEDIFEEENDK